MFSESSGNSKRLDRLKSSLQRYKELIKHFNLSTDEDKRVLVTTLLLTTLEDEEIIEIFSNKEKYKKHSIKMKILKKGK